MNQTHLHLLITHLPIFGSILGGLVLAYGLYSKSNHTKIASYGLFIISALGGGVSYLTGEAAEHTVEDIQGISDTMIEQHEDFALYALVSLIILGVISIIGIYLTIKRSTFSRSIAVVIFFIALISYGLVARTGYLGGQIRHTEINANSATIVENIDNDTESD